MQPVIGRRLTLSQPATVFRMHFNGHWRLTLPQVTNDVLWMAYRSYIILHLNLAEGGWCSWERGWTGMDPGLKTHE